MARLVVALGLLAVVLGCAGCGGDDARQAVSNAKTAITERAADRTTTVSPPQTQATTTVTPPATQTVTETTSPSTVTQTRTVVTSPGNDNDNDDTLLVILIVVGAAIVAIAVIGGLWRALRPETAVWKTQADRARATARWAADDLTVGLLDPNADTGRMERWQASKPVIDDAVRGLRTLSTRARHRRNAADTLGVADALAALAAALYAHARSPGQDGAGLVRERANDLLGRLPEPG